MDKHIISHKFAFIIEFIYNSLVSVWEEGEENVLVYKSPIYYLLFKHRC